MDLLLALGALLLWLALIYDNRHHIRHDQWHDDTD
jgi:hypothetical protein